MTLARSDRPGHSSLTCKPTSARAGVVAVSGAVAESISYGRAGEASIGAK